MLKKVITCNTSIHKGFSLTTWKFTGTGMMTLGRAWSSSSKESQHLVNNYFTIGKKNFKSGETTLGYVFIATSYTSMLAIDVIVLGVKILS